MISSSEVKLLSERGLSLLRLTSEQLDALRETRHGAKRFSLNFPHKDARAGRKQSLVLVSILGAKRGLRIGLIRSVGSTATFDSRVLFDFISPISPASLEALLRQVTQPSLRSALANLTRSEDAFQAISPKLSERLVELIAADPINAPMLRSILVRLDRPKRFETARALQQDALGLALKAFGAVEGAEAISLSGDSALGTVRLQEDAVIEHDARWIPGWRLADSDVTGRAVFTRPDARLEVFTANKRALEELLGVDLIYLNVDRGALVMVQYKMMEPGQRVHRRFEKNQTIWESEDREWIVPIDEQFKEELQRMMTFDKDLSPDGPYRLNSGAFFFKFVKRHAGINSAGIMLSLGHFEKLMKEGNTSGPRGGLRVSYRDLDGHYLRSEPFVDLVSSGYIGTRGATTAHLLALINAALSGGRAVVAALQSSIIREVK